VQVTETTSNDRPVDKAPGVGIDDHTHKARRLLPLIQAGKIDHPPYLQAHEENVIRSRCDKAAQVGIDVHTRKARKLLSNLSITIEDAILRLSPELKVLVRNTRSTANYAKGQFEVETHGDRNCSEDSGQDNDEEVKHQDDDDGLPSKHPKEDEGISTDSLDEDIDEVQKTEESEQVCATTMLAFAVPKEPSTDPLDLLNQKMEEMQRSFAQQMQDLAGQLHSKKKILKPQKKSGPAMAVATVDNASTSLANPPPPPLSPLGDMTSTQKVQRTKRRATKRKFNGSIKNYNDGAKRQRKPSRVELELEEATAINGPDVLAKLKTLGFAIIKDYDQVRVDGTYVFESLFAEENKPTREQAFFYDNTFNTPGGVPSAKKPQLETIFEGVRINAKNWDFKGVASPVDESFGKQQRMVMKNGLSGHKAYNAKYSGQMEDIIKKLFASKKADRNKYNPAADPQNWNMTQNIVIGGVNHQHPHCDQGKAGAFLNESVFPFVAIHGFGIHDFEVWLLPAKKKQREYGFLAKLDKKSILFMRGDFIHAGSHLQESRSHLEFFPLHSAGWPHPNPYWGPTRFEKWKKEQNTFLVPDLRSYPFGYPKYAEQDAEGYQVVTYPPRLTSKIVTIVDSSTEEDEDEQPKKKMKLNPLD
jgi:hypothetical protein